jgi:hypothetical protein
MVFKKTYLLAIGLLVYYAPHTSCMMDYVPLFAVKKTSQEKKLIVSEFIIDDVTSLQTKRIIGSLQQYEKEDLQLQLAGWTITGLAVAGPLLYMAPEVGVFPAAASVVGASCTAMALALHNAGYSYSYLYSTDNTPRQHNLLTLAGRSALERNIHKTLLDPHYIFHSNAARICSEFVPLQLFNAQQNKTVAWKPNDPVLFKKIINGAYNSEDWSLTPHTRTQ